MNLSQAKLAQTLQASYQRVNELVNKKRGITPSSALRLAKVFNTSEDFWLNLQLRFDLYHAKQKEGDILDTIHLNTHYNNPIHHPNFDNKKGLMP
ncbi:HigA protein (antitoxin to HigB) [uncultured Candidatus Thioglobus sp.]|nr:HigA protein (antitoxin to HigB) [uncultured Candidatus Thioglobus sp.]